MARRPHRAQPPGQSGQLREFDHFAVFDEAVNADFAADGFGGQAVGGDRQVEFFGQMRHAADVILMQMSDEDFAESPPCSMNLATTWSSTAC